jgi:hypothetical protein
VEGNRSLEGIISLFRCKYFKVRLRLGVVIKGKSSAKLIDYVSWSMRSVELSLFDTIPRENIKKARKMQILRAFTTQGGECLVINKTARPSSYFNPSGLLAALPVFFALPVIPDTISFPSSIISVAACFTVSYRRLAPTLSSPTCCNVLFLSFLVFLASFFLVFLPSSVANNPAITVPKAAAAKAPIINFVCDFIIVLFFVIAKSGKKQCHSLDFSKCLSLCGKLYFLPAYGINTIKDGKRYKVWKLADSKTVAG